MRDDYSFTRASSFRRVNAAYPSAVRRLDESRPTTERFSEKNLPNIRKVDGIRYWAILLCRKKTCSLPASRRFSFFRNQILYRQGVVMARARSLLLLGGE